MINKIKLSLNTLSKPFVIRRLALISCVIVFSYILLLTTVPRTIIPPKYLESLKINSTPETPVTDEDRRNVQESLTRFAKGGKAVEGVDFEDEGDDFIDGVANSTLNLEKIFYINTPNRFDREDTIILQSAITGLQTEYVKGVLVEDITTKGLPPDSRQGKRLSLTEAACYRSHVKVWHKIIKENIQSALVLESDATWDVNLRHSMYHLGHGIETMMTQQGFLLPGEGPTKEDPLLSSHWDLLQLGGCFPTSQRINLSMQYYDPYAPKGLPFRKKMIKDNHRILRYRGTEVCTVGYAISRRGALKLLLRTATNMEQPVDLVILDMMNKGQLVSYSVWPILINQWIYKKQLGMGYKNSEVTINNSSQSSVKGSVWQTVSQSLNPWTYRFAGDSRFANGLLENLKKSIFEDPRLEPENKPTPSVSSVSDPTSTKTADNKVEGSS